MIEWPRILRRVRFVAVAFTILVFVGLIVNAVVVRNADPIPPTKIDELVSRLNQEPADGKLVEEIHRQDVWLRQSYVRGQRFSGAGFLLLLGGVTVWLLCLKGEKLSHAAASAPVPDAPERARARISLSHQGTVATGVALGAGLSVIGVFARHDSIDAYMKDSRMPVASGAAKSEAKPGGDEASVPPLAVDAIPMAGSASPGASTALSPLPIPGSGTTIKGPITAIPKAPAGEPTTSLAPLPVVKATAGGAKPKGAPGPVAALGLVNVGAGVWPYFRGAGAGSAGGNLPAAWDGPSKKGVLWSTETPLPGWGSPVVANGKVFLSGGAADSHAVFAFDAKTGSLQWKQAIPVLCTNAKASPDAGQAPSTPAADGKFVVAAFVNGDVAGLDHSGKVLWSKTFGPMENQYGYSTCPILVDGKVILQLDQGSSPEDGKSRLMALDPATGKTIWEVKRPVSSSWSTPVVAKAAGKTLVVVCGNPLLMAYDIANGAEVWRAEGMSGEIVPGVALGAGCFYVAQMGGQAMAVGVADGKVRWTNSELALPDVSSPVYSDGLLFMSAPDGTLTALDAKSGVIVWEHNMGAPARSSPLIAEGKLIIFGSDGSARLVQVGRTFKLLATLKLGETVLASPALVDGRLYVRGEKRLYCLGAK